MNIFKNTNSIKTCSEKIENNKYILNIECEDGLYLINIKNNKFLTVNINNTILNLNLLTNFIFIVKPIDNKIELIFTRLYNNIITDTCIDSISISNYGEPEYSNIIYNVFYSFDSNYFDGAFASIYSLLYNFNQEKIDDLNLILCIPQEDLEIFSREFNKFVFKMNIKFKYTLIFGNDLILDSNILSTKCYKGGNHLLKLSNYSRLVIGHLVDCKNVLYLDSDTIIQSDLSLMFDKVGSSDFTIMAKQAELFLKNILNSNNIEHTKKFMGDNFILDKNIIYTGTILINPKKYKLYFPKMMDLVKLHNNIDGGLYKFFTISIINIALFPNVDYIDSYLNNVVDLGFRNNIEEKIITGDVLDWNGIFKPWFKNGMYQQFWNKYNIMYTNENIVEYNKNTVEKF